MVVLQREAEARKAEADELTQQIKANQEYEYQKYLHGLESAKNMRDMFGEQASDSPPSFFPTICNNCKMDL